MENSVRCNVLFIGSLFLSAVAGVDILDIQTTHKEKECYGSNRGFSFSGTHEYHYESLRRRYTGCTHLQGNLEITNLNNGNMTYDLGFLSSIKVVTGYVLLGLLNVETIPLTSLQLIRADDTLQIANERYGLVVVLNFEGTPTPDNPTPGLKELQLPNLREISNGKVLFTQNPLLCYIDTVEWDGIVDGDIIMNGNATRDTCGRCHEDCNDFTDVGHCWGAGANMCQMLNRMQCDSQCPGSPKRCFSEGADGCCHAQCALGCRGPLDTDCEMCKYYRHGNRCVQECPKSSYPIGKECVDFEKN